MSEFDDEMMDDTLDDMLDEPTSSTTPEGARDTTKATRAIYLDCREMREREAAHNYLKEKLELPDYYGKNLDALFDCLSEIPATEVVFENVDYLWDMGDYGEALLETFLDAAAERDDLSISTSDE